MLRIGSFRILALTLSALLSSLALFAMTLALASTTARAAQTPVFETPFGIGVLLGRAIEQAGQAIQYALVLEGQNHFKQRRGTFGYRQYGQGQTRFEVGNGVGIRLSATTGFSIVGLPPAGGTFSPQLGVEPFNGRIALHTQSAVARYYEWMPMISAGMQFGFANGCRLLPLVRGGGGFGTIGKGGWSPEARLGYGAGTYFNCARFDAAMEITRLEGRGGGPAFNLATLDWVYTVRPGGTMKLGLRGESDLGRGGSSIRELTEQRVMFLLRGELRDDR